MRVSELSTSTYVSMLRYIDQMCKEEIAYKTHVCRYNGKSKIYSWADQKELGEK